MGKINITDILEQFGNDRELLDQVIYDFSKELPRYVADLQVACNTSNWQEVYRLAHKIHGAAANFLDNPVRQISKQMEIMAKRNQTGGLLELAKHLDAQTKDFLQELNALASQKAAS